MKENNNILPLKWETILKEIEKQQYKKGYQCNEIVENTILQYSTYSKETSIRLSKYLIIKLSTQDEQPQSRALQLCTQIVEYDTETRYFTQELLYNIENLKKYTIYTCNIHPQYGDAIQCHIQKTATKLIDILQKNSLNDKLLLQNTVDTTIKSSKVNNFLKSNNDLCIYLDTIIEKQLEMDENCTSLPLLNQCKISNLQYQLNESQKNELLHIVRWYSPYKIIEQTLEILESYINTKLYINDNTYNSKFLHPSVISKVLHLLILTYSIYSNNTYNSRIHNIFSHLMYSNIQSVKALSLKGIELISSESEDNSSIWDLLQGGTSVLAAAADDQIYTDIGVESDMNKVNISVDIV